MSVVRSTELLATPSAKIRHPAVCRLPVQQAGSREAHRHRDSGRLALLCQAKGFGAPTAGRSATAATPKRQCPCGSGDAYNDCCRPYHNGAVAPTAEAMMRSRYSAYSKGLVAYVVATTHPDNALARGVAKDGTPSGSTLAEDVRATVDKVAWERLKVLSAEEGSHADEAFVTFQVRVCYE